MIEKLKNPASGNWLFKYEAAPAALTRRNEWTGITGATSKAGYWSGEDGGGNHAATPQLTGWVFAETLCEWTGCNG